MSSPSPLIGSGTPVLTAGWHARDWDLKRRDGLRLSPGIYSYRLISGTDRAERKLVVLP